MGTTADTTFTVRLAHHSLIELHRDHDEGGNGSVVLVAYNQATNTGATASSTGALLDSMFWQKRFQTLRSLYVSSNCRKGVFSCVTP